MEEAKRTKVLRGVNGGGKEEKDNCIGKLKDKWIKCFKDELNSPVPDMGRKNPTASEEEV